MKEKITMETINIDLKDDEDMGPPSCSCCDNTRYLLKKYNELIMEVQNKNPGESRHSTALRYIRERENYNSDEQAFQDLF